MADEQQPRKQWDAYSLGIQLVLMLALSFYGGWKLDEWFPSLAPWGVFGGIIFGLASMVWYGLREMKKINS